MKKKYLMKNKLLIIKNEFDLHLSYMFINTTYLIQNNVNFYVKKIINEAIFNKLIGTKFIYWLLFSISLSYCLNKY